jgi:hypothetical protein
MSGGWTPGRRDDQITLCRNRAVIMTADVRTARPVGGAGAVNLLVLRGGAC